MDNSYVQGGAEDAISNPEAEQIQVWLDPSLPTRPAILQWLVSQGAIISTDHTDPDTRIIILHPSSIEIFDRYCHPAWLPPRQRIAYRRMLRAGGVEEWRRKVILSEMWPKLCRETGIFLGEEEDWGGCRKAGPPRKIKQVMPLPPLERVGIVQQLPDPNPPTTPSSPKTPQAEPITDGLEHTFPLDPLQKIQDETDVITTTIQELSSEAGQPGNKDVETNTVVNPTESEITPLPADPAQPFPSIHHAHEVPRRPFNEDYDGSQDDGLPPTEHVPRPINEGYAEGESTSVSEPSTPWLHTSGAVPENTVDKRAEATMIPSQAGPSGWQHTSGVISTHNVEATSVPPLTPHTSRATTVDDEGFQLGRQTTVEAPVVHHDVVPNPYIPRTVSANRSVVLSEKDRPHLQVSRWQTIQSTPVILQGKGLYLDRGRFGRKSTAANIVKSGGRIRHDIFQASHALLNPVKSSDRAALNDLIRRVSQANIWCVGFDWIEDSWEQGRLLPEWDYVYEGGAPANRIGKPRHPLPPRPPVAELMTITQDEPEQRTPNGPYLSTEELGRIFGDAVDEHDRTGMTWVQTTAEIMKKHGTYSLSHWVNLLTEYRGKTGRFAGYSLRKEPQLSLNDLDNIFNKAHPMSQKRGSCFADVVRHLVATRNEYCQNVWETLYREWRTSTGRFANLRSGPSVSRQERLLKEYDEYSALFQPYRQMWKAGAGRDEIYRKIARENPEYKYSHAVWGTYFGNWLRGRSINTNEELATRSDQINTPSPDRPSRAILSTAELANLFKAEYDSDTFTAAQVAERVAAKYNYAPRSISNYYNEWRRRTGRFQGIVSSSAYSGLAPSRATDRSASNQESPSTTKKSLEAASSRSSPTKKVKNSYTDAEEAKMAVYITSRLPTPTEPRSADWEIFAKDNPARTHAAWVEHYRQYRARINDLVTKLGGHIPGKRTPNAKRKREGSDDSIVFVAHQDKRQRTEDVEVVDLVDSDED